MAKKYTNNFGNFPINEDEPFCDASGKHVVSLFEEENSIYNKVFFTAYNKRFPSAFCDRVKEEKKGESAKVVASESEPVVVEAPKKRKSSKRLFFIILVTLISALSIAFAAISYFGSYPDYTSISGGNGLKPILLLHQQDLSAYTEIGDLALIYALPTTITLSLVLSLVVFISAFVAMFSRKRINFLWIVELVALVCLIAFAAVLFIGAGLGKTEVAGFLNPTNRFGLVYGYYILLALEFLAFFFGIFAYRRRK